MILYFGGILFVVPKHLRYKKELLELSWEKWGWDSCRNLYKELKISPSNHNTYCLLLFMTTNKDNFIKNLVHYSIYTRHNKDLYLPQGNLVIYQTGFQYSGVNIFNNLPSDIKSASGNTKILKNPLKHFLSSHSFYTLDEYCNR